MPSLKSHASVAIQAAMNVICRMVTCMTYAPWENPVCCSLSVMCVKGQRGAHACRWARWKQKIQDDSETNNWLAANTKPCPKCGKPVEKNGGCNLVVCKCRQVQQLMHRHTFSMPQTAF